MAREKVDPGFPSKLGDGYKAFYYGRLRHERDRYERLAASGQKPEVMIIACCDSRAAPELIFDAAPGEVFVVRNVANMVPPYAPDDEYHGTSAALEFAVQALKVMRDHNVGCLPVVKNERLVGIVTQRDFMDVARDLLAEKLEELDPAEA